MNKIRMKMGFTLIELLVVLAIIGLILSLVGGAVTSCAVSNGSRKGNLTKFAHKGLMFKTYEGELVMGGLNANGGANVWDFSVKRNNPNKDKIVAELNQAIELDVPVTIKYEQSYFVNLLNGNTSYDAIEVKVHTNSTSTAKETKSALPPLESN